VTEKDFWGILAKLDWKRTGDDEAVIAPAVRELSRRPLADIKSFQEILAAKLHSLDGKAWARQTGDDSYKGRGKHFSVDQFLYARCCVVANGKEAYENVLGNPKEMPRDMDFEPLLWIAGEAHEKKTGQEFDCHPKVSYETFSNRKEWK